MAYAEKKDAVKHANEYNSSTYDRLNILVAKGERERIKAHAESRGQSLNGYVVGLIREDMGEDAEQPTGSRGE